jgi:hypothetical protein
MPSAGLIATSSGAPPSKGSSRGKKLGSSGNYKLNLYSYPARSAKSFITK